MKVKGKITSFSLGFAVAVYFLRPEWKSKTDFPCVQSLTSHLLKEENVAHKTYSLLLLHYTAEFPNSTSPLPAGNHSLQW